MRRRTRAQNRPRAEPPARAEPPHGARGRRAARAPAHENRRRTARAALARKTAIGPNLCLCIQKHKFGSYL